MTGNMVEALRRIQKNKATQSKILDLNGLGLTKLPEELWDCVWVEELGLGYYYSWNEEKQTWVLGAKDVKMANRLANLPNAISNFKELTKLFLDGNPVSDIHYLSGLESLKNLNLRETQVKDVRSLGRLMNLSLLDLRSTRVNDVNVLSGLTNLNTLNLCSTQVNDLRGLSVLVNLRSLDLSRTQVRNVSALSELVNLSSLDLSGTQVSEVNALRELINLSYLDLRETQVNDVNALRGLENLSYLDLRSTQVNDVNGLSGLRSLKNLNLGGTQVEDVSALSGLVKLSSLDLRSTRVSNLSALGSLENLKNLNLRETRVNDVGALSSLENLKRLYLRSTQISDISALSELINLSDLDLRSTQVRNLNALSRLTNLYSLDLHETQVTDVNPLSGLLNLNKLYLGSTQIIDVGVLSKLVNLTTLDLSETQVNNVSALSGLVKLNRLNLHSTRVSDTGSLSRLVNLSYLDLGDTQVSDVNSLRRLVNLRNLYLRYTQVSDVSGLSELGNLSSLDLSDTRVNDVRSLGGLVNLSRLYLRYTEVSDVSCFSSLINLTRLNLRYTRVNDVSSLRGLVNLSSLDLSSTKISDVKSLSNLLNLSYFDLSYTQVSDISVLNSMENLSSLYLNDTRVSDVSALRRLVNLGSLYLRYTRVSDVSALSDLKNLVSLDLSYTRVNNLSPLSGLVNLSHLNLRSTQISDVFALKELVNLSILDLSYTRVSHVNGLNGLVNLRNLNLRSTQVNNVNGLSGLANLCNLNLHSTQVSEVSGLSGLMNLSNLNLRSTQVNDVSGLSGLVNLSSLYLSESSIPFFPFNLLFLPKLETLKLYNTHCLNLPPELTYASNALPDLKNYYAELQKNAYTSYEAKILTIGNGRVGKTSVLKALFQLGNFDPEEDSTHGIQLFEAALSLPQKQATASLRLWDFGGQELYHATHRIFMKSRALYILVWDSSTEQKIGENFFKAQGKEFVFRNFPLSYWLGNIRALSKDAKIIVVCNKADTGQEHFPEQLNALQTQYKIDSFLSVSAKTSYGILSLHYRMLYLLEQMPEMGMPMPVSWKNVQDKLAGIQAKPYLDFTEYRTVCAEEGLTEGSVYTLLRFLHHSGFLFWHEEYLKHQIILDQKWALEAIYKLLDRNSWYEILKGNGLRKRSALAKCWGEYTSAQVQLFLEMMQSCELALKIGDELEEDPTYLIPEFLPDYPTTAVEYSWEASSSSVYYFRFQHHFFHAALIQRFIVRSAKLAESYDLLWHTGLLLKVNGTLARIQVYPEAGRIEMQVRGANPAELIERLKNEITEIQEVDGKVGFMLSLSGKDSEWVTLEQLQLQHEKGKTQIASTSGEILELALFRILIHTANREEDEATLDLKELAAQQSGTQLLKTSNTAGFNDFKSIAKRKLVDGIDVAIAYLQEHIHSSSSSFDDLIILQGQWEDFKRQDRVGILSKKNNQISQSQIRYKMLSLINSLNE